MAALPIIARRTTANYAWLGAASDRGTRGISSHVRPSSIRPASFLLMPARLQDERHVSSAALAPQVDRRRGIHRERVGEPRSKYRHAVGGAPMGS